MKNGPTLKSHVIYKSHFKMSIMIEKLVWDGHLQPPTPLMHCMPSYYTLVPWFVPGSSWVFMWVFYARASVDPPQLRKGSK